MPFQSASRLERPASMHVHREEVEQGAAACANRGASPNNLPHGHLHDLALLEEPASPHWGMHVAGRCDWFQPEQACKNRPLGERHGLARADRSWPCPSPMKFRRAPNLETPNRAGRTSRCRVDACSEAADARKHARSMSLQRHARKRRHHIAGARRARARHPASPGTPAERRCGAIHAAAARPSRGPT